MAVKFFEIPLQATPQSFAISIGGKTYRMQLIYRDGCFANWVLDLADNVNNPIISGIPLIDGADLLAQYAYLQLGFSLYCTFAEQIITFTGLGINQRLFAGIENGT